MWWICFLVISTVFHVFNVINLFHYNFQFGVKFYLFHNALTFCSNRRLRYRRGLVERGIVRIWQYGERKATFNSAWLRKASWLSSVLPRFILVLHRQWNGQRGTRCLAPICGCAVAVPGAAPSQLQEVRVHTDEWSGRVQTPFPS